MAVFTNGVVLVVTLFAFNWAYGMLSDKMKNIPIVSAGWIDLLSGKSERSIHQRAYEMYSKAKKGFRINRDCYVVPPALFPEVRRLPSTVLHSSQANEDFLMLARSLGHDYWDVITFVRQNVMRSMANQASPVQDEIRYQMARQFGDSGDWRSVPAWPTTFTMMTSIATRFLVGKELSRNEAFTKKIGEFTRAVSIEALALGKLPAFTKPVVTMFLKSKTRYRTIREMLRPYVMALLHENEDGTIVMAEREAAIDEPMLPQFVAFVLPKYSHLNLRGDEMKERILNEVVGRYLGLFFAAIDTTTMTFSQSFLDVVGHPRGQYADRMREEVKEVLKRHNGIWSKDAINELKHMDSFIHESQRLHPIGSLLAGRKVLPAQGVTFSNGDHIPQGCLIQLPIWFVQTDSEKYEAPNEFRGFRFVEDKHPESVPSDVFCSFGHGNHACPGRRFALMVVKLMLCEILLSYEYEELPERPEDFLFGPGIMPDPKKEVRIRRVTE